MYEKLSDYAKRYGVTYRTAWNRYKKGKIKDAFEDNTGHIIIPIKEEKEISNNVALYARVSSNDRKNSLDDQLKRLKNYSISNGYNITHSIKEIASGMNDNRNKLSKLLIEDNWDILIVENKDRLTRFGFNYIDILLKKLNKKIIVVNKTDDDKTDLMSDLISIIYSFSARMYGLRKRKKKSEIIQFIEE
jgi:predicted site-specific integrase-resolvase